MQKDTIYQQSFGQITSFKFDEKVVSVFPDMIQRSVPGYNTIIGMTGVLAQRHALPGSNIYDLGCSLGASLLSIHEHLFSDNYQLIGVDNSQAMLDRCKMILPKINSLTLQLENIEDTIIQNASVVVMNFSLQFIPITQRDKILKRIADSMLPGGILILSEKILFEDEHLNQLNIDLHHQFKKSNGYSELEISQKRNALEDVLLPETIKNHQARIKKAGFSRCDVWFQCFNFASLIAIK